MPNVTPREAPVWDSAGAKREAAAFYIYDIVSGARIQRPVHRMWVWDGNTHKWEVAWADAPTPPSTVTATWVQSGTSVTLTWVNPTPRVADQWQIERPDGSVVATLPYTTMTVSDPEPRPLNGAYLVRGVLGSMVGPGTSSNSLDLRLLAVSLTGTWNEGLQRVDFGGTGPALGYPDQWYYYRNDDGSFVGANTNPSPTGWDNGPHLGSLYSYSVRPVLGNVVGGATNSANVAVPPHAPRVQWWTASGTSNLQLGFWGPDAGISTDFQVETSPDNASWTVRDAHNTSGIFNFATTDTTYVRVRTNAPGGTRYSPSYGATPVNDVTPPGDVSWQSFVPEGTYGRMVMRAYLPGDGDLNYAQIERFAPGIDGGWVVLWASGVGPSQYLALDCGTFGPGQSIYCRVYVRDVNGNARYSSEVNYTLTPSPTGVSAQGFNYWIANPSQYNLDGSHHPHEGYFSDPSKWTIGFMYYGTAIRDACIGKTVYAIDVVIIRIAGGSAVPGMVTLCLHPYLSDPGTVGSGQPETYGLTDIGDMNIGDVAQPALPSDFVNQLAAGAMWGIGMFRYPTGKPYQIYAHNGDNGFAGAVQVYHLG